MRGGHGNAGWMRHKKSAVIRYGIEIAEPGFRSINRNPTNILNIEDLVQKIDQFIQEGYAKQSDGKLDVELGRAGYTKLLGRGKVDKPLRVTVGQVSKQAAEKISHAGGEIIPPTKQKEG